MIACSFGRRSLGVAGHFGRGRGFHATLGWVAVALLGCKEEAQRTAPPPEPTPSVMEISVEEPVAPKKRVFSPSETTCQTVEVFERGEAAGRVCTSEASSLGLTILDLSDNWTPRVFVPSPISGEAPEYRAKYLALASTPSSELGLNGIAPTLSILSGRLADEKRRACHGAIDRSALSVVEGSLSPDLDDRARGLALKQAQTKAPLTVIQSELACEGLLKTSQVNGRMQASTQIALEAFRRRHMIVGTGLDAGTIHALSLGGEELSFRGLLRGLRERVVDAAGLLEDGTASETHALVVDRELDLTRFAPEVVEAVKGGAPDLVDMATDRAARELGWSTPDAVRAFIVSRGKGGFRDLKVAVTLPPPPAYHSAKMELRVEIDRGDVFYQAPSEAAVARKKLEQRRAPTFVIYAKDSQGGEVALMRWATTIGGWKKERAEDGEISLKYKESDVGDRVWRQIIAAPAWMPPDSTPETDLLHEDKEGNFALKRDLIQPGYRNAYGLVMLIHHEGVERDGKTRWLDHGIRTHGSVDYRSIQKGTSHGCHRLYNQLALRLSGFLLQHRESVRRGKMHSEYRRTLEHNEQTIEVEVPTRGYLFELDPPVPVRVLKGNVVGEVRKPVSIALPTDAPKKG